MNEELTEQQVKAFQQLPGMELIASRIEGKRGNALVKIEGALFLLSPGGLLTRWHPDKIEI